MTGDDPILTGKIALAHLREFPDYSTRLAVMKAEGEGSACAPRAPDGSVRPGRHVSM